MMTSTTLPLSAAPRHSGARYLLWPRRVRRWTSRRSIWCTCAALAFAAATTVGALDFIRNAPQTLYDTAMDQVTPLLGIAFGHALQVSMDWLVGAFGVSSALAFTTMGVAGLRIESRQRAERRPLRIPVQVDSSEGSYEAGSENISVGGLLLATDHPHAVGDKLQLRFQLPNQQTTVSVEAEVRWVRRRADTPAATPTGVGLQFHSSDWWSTAALRRFLA